MPSIILLYLLIPIAIYGIWAVLMLCLGLDHLVRMPFANMTKRLYLPVSNVSTRVNADYRDKVMILENTGSKVVFSTPDGKVRSLILMAVPNKKLPIRSQRDFATGHTHTEYETETIKTSETEIPLLLMANTKEVCIQFHGSNLIQVSANMWSPSAQFSQSKHIYLS